VRRTANLLLAALWIASIATFGGWKFVAWVHDMQAAREYFYVAQGALGCLVFLSLLIRWTVRQRLVVLLLAVYGAAEQALVAMCGAAWYWHYSGTTPLGPICNQAHGWSWSVLVLAAITLWAIRRSRQ
jgi:hypothetical protein